MSGFWGVPKNIGPQLAFYILLLTNSLSRQVIIAIAQQSRTAQSLELPGKSCTRGVFPGRKNAISFSPPVPGIVFYFLARWRGYGGPKTRSDFFSSFIACGKGFQRISPCLKGSDLFACMLSTLEPPTFGKVSTEFSRDPPNRWLTKIYRACTYKERTTLMTMKKTFSRSLASYEGKEEKSAININKLGKTYHTWPRLPSRPK